MASIVDALVITLGLDPSDYEKGSKRAATAHKKVTESVVKGTKEIAAESKGAAQAISQLRSDAIALLAVFLGGRGFKDFVQDIGFGDAAMARFARTSRTSMRELSTWASVAKMAGGTGDDLVGTIQGLSDQYSQWQLTGESAIAPYLRALQTINPNLRLDENGHMADPGKFLLELADTAKMIPDKSRVRTLFQGLGIDSNTINLLILGRGAMEAFRKEIQAVQGPLEASGKAGADIQREWAVADESLKGVGRTLLVAIAPTLIEVLHLVRDFALWAQQHPQLIANAFWVVTVAVLALSVALSVNLARLALVQTAAGFSILIGLIPKLLLGLAVLTETSLPALSAAFLATGAAIEATPIGWILTGIAALAVAGYELYEHWDEVKKWWAGLWDDMADIPDLAVRRAKAAQGASVWDTILSSVGIGGYNRDAYNNETGGGAAGHGASSAPGSAPVGGGGGGPYSEEGVQAFLRGAVPGVRITGGARTPERNAAVGGVANSMHLSGQAVDFVLPNGTSFAQFKAMLDASGFHYSELLNEGQIGGQGAHVHLGWGPKRLAHLPRAHHAVQARSGNVNNSKTVHSDTRIGSVIVNTPATDGPGVARDIHAELSTHGLAVQANSGLA